MHSVERSPEPAFMPQYRQWFQTWCALKGRERTRIRDELRHDFGPVCPFCEKRCEDNSTPGVFCCKETIDHFMPRSRYRPKYLDWLNLIYCCDRCNGRKDESWPTLDGDATDEKLREEYPGYIPVSSYVSPNLGDGIKPASAFFSYDETGRITPANGLDPTEFSMALRTIHDLDLNDCWVVEHYKKKRSSESLDHTKMLYNRRLEQKIRVKCTLDHPGNDPGAFDETLKAVLAMAHPSQQFSGIVRAYLEWRLPALRPILTALLAQGPRR